MRTPQTRSTVIRIAFAILSLFALATLAGCSSDSDEASDSKTPALSTEAANMAAIQATLDEVITRWRHGDKSGLFENEFPYIKYNRTYKDYITSPYLEGVRADSVLALNLQEAQFFGKDSAHIKVEVVMMNSLGDSTLRIDEYPVYFHDGRWIRPTLTNWAAQKQFEQIREAADSAAQAEGNEDW